MSIFDLFADPRESPFLRQAADGALGEDERQLYAGRLAEWDPARAEWLRLEIALHARATPDPAERARFDELCGTCDRDWVHLLRRDQILNCGGAEGEPRQIRFQRVCERRWESLEPTEHDGVRRCDTCKQNVFYTLTAREAEAHAVAGDCIAVPRTLRNGGVDLDTRHMLGRPDPVGDWARRLFPGDE